MSSSEVEAKNRQNSQTILGRQNSGDFLLVGCVNSILFYEPITRTKLFSLNTGSPIERISFNPLDSILLINGTYIDRSSLLDFDKPTASVSLRTTGQLAYDNLAVCSGPNKLYTLKLDSKHSELSNGRAQLDSELTSERSTSDTITCLTLGNCLGADHVLTGSSEGKIRLYQLDSFDHNLHTSRLTIEESDQVNCLCPIRTTTSQPNSSTSASKQLIQIGAKLADTDADQNSGHSEGSSTQASGLPSIKVAETRRTIDEQQASEQMNHFGYGLENNHIGVYYLFESSQTRRTSSIHSLALDPISHLDNKRQITFERLWRHKCKHTPSQMIMYDINGDGYDELMIGYKNGRLEARAPFTGQLLAATRCFRVSDRLAGLTLIGYEQNNSLRLLLAACSTNGTLIVFKSKQFRSPQPLRGYSAKHRPSLSLRNMSISSVAYPLDMERRSVASELDSESTSLAKSDAIAARLSVQDALTLARDSDTRELIASDLHIESKGDDSKPSKCDSKQNLDLLHKLNGLQCKKFELEQRACQLIRSKLVASKFSMTDLNINHRWDFDMERVSLKD